MVPVMGERNLYQTLFESRLVVQECTGSPAPSVANLVSCTPTYGSESINAAEDASSLFCTATAPSCTTSTALLAIIARVDRDAVEKLAVAVKLADPLPFPFGVSASSHAASDIAVQTQPSAD